LICPLKGERTKSREKGVLNKDNMLIWKRKKEILKLF